MGQILIVVEGLAGCLLLTATLLACVSRVGRKWVRRMLLVPLLLASFLLPAAFLALLIWVATGYPVYAAKAVGFEIASAAFVVAWFIECWLGLRRGSLPARRASGWPRSKLALAFVVVAALAGMTFWNQDLAARQELAMIRAEAGAMAASVAPARVPDSQNAALLYQQVFDMLDADKETEKKLDPLLAQPFNADPLLGRPFNRDDPKVWALLEQNRSLIALLHQAGEKPACNFNRQYQVLDIPLALPFLSASRAGNILVNSAAVNGAQGRTVDAMEDLNAAFALGDRMTDTPLLASRMVASRIQNFSARRLEELMGETSPTPASLAALRLGESMSFARDFQRCLVMEEAAGLFGFSTFPPDVFEWYELTMLFSGKGKLTWAVMQFGSFYRVFFLTEDVQVYRACFTEMQPWAGRPYYAARQAWEGSRRKARNLGRMMGDGLIRTVGGIAGTMAKADAQRQGCVLGVAMYRYRLKHGQFPESLDKLVPEFVPVVPLDPFDGKPMRLAKSPYGGWVVYSVGPDGVDDGGRALATQPEEGKPPKGDITFRVGARPSSRPDGAGKHSSSGPDNSSPE